MTLDAFRYRLRKHIREFEWVSNNGNKKHNTIERIARKSLVCFILGLCTNLAMNLLKITDYLGNASDALTVYFHIVESTLIVEALRNDRIEMPNPNPLCSGCGVAMQFNKNTTIAESFNPNVTIDIPASLPSETCNSDTSDAVVHTSTVELFQLANNKNSMSDVAM